MGDLLLHLMIYSKLVNLFLVLFIEICGNFPYMLSKGNVLQRAEHGVLKV